MRLTSQYLIVAFLGCVLSELIPLSSVTLYPSSAQLTQHFSLQVSQGRHITSIPVPNAPLDSLRITSSGKCVVDSFENDAQVISSSAITQHEVQQGLTRYLSESQLHVNYLTKQYQQQTEHVELLQLYLSSSADTFLIKIDEVSRSDIATQKLLATLTSLSQQLQVLNSTISSVKAVLQHLQDFDEYNPSLLLASPAYLPHEPISYKPTTHHTALVSLFAQEDAHCSLHVSYVADASWSTTYDILLSSTPQHAVVHMYAKIHQNSGTDWICSDHCYVSTATPTISRMQLPRQHRLHLSRKQHASATTASHHHSTSSPIHNYPLPHGISINNSHTQLLQIASFSDKIILYTDVVVGRGASFVAQLSENRFAIAGQARIYLDGNYMGTSYVDHTTTSLRLTTNYRVQGVYPEPLVLTLRSPDTISMKPIAYSKVYGMRSRMDVPHLVVMHDISHEGKYGEVSLSMTYPNPPVRADFSESNHMYHVLSSVPDDNLLHVYTDMHSNRVLYVQRVDAHANAQFVIHTVQRSISDERALRRFAYIMFTIVWLLVGLLLTRRLWWKHAQLLLLQCKYAAKNEAPACCRDDEKLHDI